MKKKQKDEETEFQDKISKYGNCDKMFQMK